MLFGYPSAVRVEIRKRRKIRPEAKAEAERQWRAKRMGAVAPANVGPGAPPLNLGDLDRIIIVVTPARWTSGGMGRNPLG